ncbi:unnamed protein product [Arctia plantaginis]|uniref:Craniofacial development protein 1 n=1 Tax=Arctia plantaginis TaxID=874455 RepID=A0A8S0YNR4_ARCPL|nr:unnamed protein product [Arctia plantaginis]
MSSGSESDEDYVPGEPEQLSEEGSADEETDQQYEHEVDQNIKKRKLVKDCTAKKKRKTKNSVKDIESNSTKKLEEIEVPANPEEEKKKEDDLWAKFLEGTDTKPRSVVKENNSNIEASKSVVNKEETPEKAAATSNDDKAREQRIFEFAGETIVVENNKIKEKIKTADSPATSSKLNDIARGRPGAAGGLSSVLGQLNKKNKLSTLEKSKLDWSTYKQEEGIEEEIESHNKGKNGYLERRDFLERADVRQYEIERDMRLNRRSNR